VSPWVERGRSRLSALGGCCPPRGRRLSSRRGIGKLESLPPRKRRPARSRHAPPAARRAIIAGYGLRSDEAVSGEAAALFGLPVISVRLVDPRFYHLDTALLILDENTAAYYPAAFDEVSQATLAAHFSELIEAKDADAETLGLNGISDGRNVVLPVQAEGLAREIDAAGFTVVPVDMSEFKKAGGGPKCCTLELR